MRKPRNEQGIARAKELRRTAYLETEGWKAIRFTNLDIVRNPEGVALMILQSLDGISPSSRQGEEA